jgi:Kdo2-lipid IVA lauroyltransferase/acyltransferase
MAKARSWYADYAVYVLVRIFVAIVQTLSVRQAFALARVLAWLVHRLDRRHREVALDNLKHAFANQMSEAERERLVRSVYQHFCGLLMEIIHLPRKIHPHTWRRFIKLKNGKELVQCLLSGRPLMIVTGHFGNWELGGYVLGLLGLQVHPVARPLDNPYLDDFLRGFREQRGQRVLAKKGDFDQMQSLLASGGVLATLADQDAGQRGLFVEFFGRPASTHKAIALLALEYQVPIVVAVARSLGSPLHYEMITEDVILPEDYADRADAVQAITQRFTYALERVVRDSPEQYFWLHRRWKHQPARPKKRVA